MSIPTLILPRERFEELKDHLAKQKFAFEDRPYQVFLAKGPGAVVNLYNNGKVIIAGNNVSLIRSLNEFVISLGAEKVVKDKHLPPLDLPFPHIGTDEVGKGDYFGPLIVAGALVPAKEVDSLRTFGVRDSKLLSDTTIRNLASQIRIVLGRRRVEEITISPLKYNALHQKMQNVNRILGWAHARAIENLLMNGEGCTLAVADQFGDPGYIRDSLLSRGKAIELRQSIRAERDLAVAAASILARDTFLRKREELNESYGVVFPKGATDVVAFGKMFIEEHGLNILPHVAKLHFSTTSEITGGQIPSISDEVKKRVAIDQVPRMSPELEREDLRVECYDLISDFERELRQFIEKRLSQEFGADWWRLCVRKEIRGKAEAMAQEEAKKGHLSKPLEFFFFQNYDETILDDNNWNRAFKTVFKKKEEVHARLSILKSHRDPVMHARGEMTADHRRDIIAATSWFKKMMRGQSSLDEF